MSQLTRQALTKTIVGQIFEPRGLWLQNMFCKPCNTITKCISTFFSEISSQIFMGLFSTQNYPLPNTSNKYITTKSQENLYYVHHVFNKLLIQIKPSQLLQLNILSLLVKAEDCPSNATPWHIHYGLSKLGTALAVGVMRMGSSIRWPILNSCSTT